MSTVIESILIDELWDKPEFEGLITEYAHESSIEGLPPPEAKYETYQALESAGVLQTFAAYECGELVGFLSLLMPIMPHYSQLVATTESYFVAHHARKSGAGLKLLRTAETFCRDHGAKGLLVSAPSHGRLAEVLPRVGYEESNRVFFRSFMCQH